MKLTRLTIQNFRCFGPVARKIRLERGVTTLVGGNGSGKTAVFLALSRLFGVTPAQRTFRRQDFHLPPDQNELASGSELAIEAIFSFPELRELNEDAAQDAVPEFFLQMAASAPGAPLRVRMRLQATWIDDGTPEGSVNEDMRWIRTLEDDFDWDDCKRVQSVERGSVQLIYVPASRDAASQVTALLKGRLWRAAKWSEDFHTRSAQSARNIQERFEREEPAELIINRLSARWSQLNEADTDTTPILRLVENRLEELVRRAEFAFKPDEAGQERSLTDLSDGQRSLFHIALTAATLEVERQAIAQPVAESSFDREKLRRAALTLLIIEEPENSLSPFFLSRIIVQAREIAAMPSAQVLLSSHSPAILSRIDPEEVRYLRLDRESRRSYVKRLALPDDDNEARQYVRLGVRAYPELYFARFVILAEGDSERLVIPRVAEAMGVQLDPSFVPIVPLAGRYVGHFWKLLRNLRIPHATLLDLDLGRAHGGAKAIEMAIDLLAEHGNDLRDNQYVRDRTVDPDAVQDLEDENLIEGYDETDWVQALKDEGLFFSYPLDLDFSMLRCFGDEYQTPNRGGRGPRRSEAAIREKKLVTLKTGGKPHIYDDDYDDQFIWYPYLFLHRSKPEAHLAALSKIGNPDLAENAPPELKDLVEHVRRVLNGED
jgi:putative ATP-dependent endonuclease of the OLD family